jgi:hypothetical protein
MADRRIWRDSDWLHAGKTYPAEPQKFICNARDAATAIPSNYKKLLPAPDLSVHDILRLALPPLSDALVLEDPTTLWTKNTPNDTMGDLLTRPIPPITILTKLDAIFGQAWFDGARSFRDWRYKESYCPLWIVSFWLEAGHAVKGRHKWIDANEWLATARSQENTSKAVVALCDNIRGSLFTELGWNIDMRDVYTKGGSTLILSNLLASSELGCSVMDLMVNAVKSRVATLNALAESVIVGDSWLSAEILGARTKAAKKIPSPLLDKLRSEIATGASKRLILLVFLKDNHWIIVQVDFKKRHISWGDSLDMGDPASFLHAVRWGLTKSTGGKRFTEGATLARGSQGDDVYSCRVIAINTIEHALWNEPLWTKETQTLIRATKFQEVANRILSLIVSAVIGLAAK